MDERRVFRRLPAALRVRYMITTRRGTEVAGEGSTVDLSAGGLLLALPPLPQMALADLMDGAGTVDVALLFVDGEPAIAARCRPVWMHAPRHPGALLELGLRFTDIEPAQRDRIHAFVAAHG